MLKNVLIGDRYYFSHAGTWDTDYSKRDDSFHFRSYHSVYPYVYFIAKYIRNDWNYDRIGF